MSETFDDAFVDPAHGRIALDDDPVVPDGHIAHNVLMPLLLIARKFVAAYDLDIGLRREPVPQQN